MPLKCPLCLSSLAESDQLVRFCLQHKTSEKFNCVENSEKLFCPDRNNSCNVTLDNGVFLYHVGCAAKNPFWDSIKKQVVLPGDDSPTFQHTSVVPHNILVQNGPPASVEVFHWQIGVLRALPGNVEEMWFPLMLWRAATEFHHRRRIGTLVELTGARSVGKTVIAVQAMDAKGYAQPCSNNEQPLPGKQANGYGQNDHDSRNLTLKDYIYSRRVGTADVPLLSMLYLRDVMGRNHSFDARALATRPGPGDLKAIFIAPAAGVESNSLSSRNDLGVSLKEAGRRVWDELKELLGLSKLSGATTTSLFPFWHAVVFYDTAGELSQRRSQILNLIEDAVSKAAILINAAELFDPKHDSTLPDSSITVARQRLSDLSEKRNIECSLVITQLDLVMNQLAPEDRQKAYEIARAVEKSPADDKEARRLLIKWLRASPAENIRGIERLLKGVKVFFVWTEGIPTDESKYKGARTYSYGLARFICWCLGVQWQEITHVETIESSE